MNRPVRIRGLVLLLILMVVAAIGTVTQDIRFDRSLAAERASAVAIDRGIESGLLALADLRTAQAGYVASGQGAAFWMTRVTDLTAALIDTVSTLKSTSSSAAAIEHYGAAAAAVAEFQKLDGRARSLVKSDQRPLAADVIFMDGLGVTLRATRELADARDVEQAASEGRIATIGRLRLAMNAGCLLVAVLVAGVLLRATLVWMSPVAATTPAPQAQTGTPVSPAAAPAQAPAPAEVNLADAAELCLDLARVLDARDVGALFDRAALVLEAKGLVLWSIDTSGALLRPTLTHGYSEKVLARMSGLQVDSDNVTALAFRSMQAQVVAGQSAGASGALAVPLITANGCVGVLSAEIKRSKPGKDTVAVGKMIAAQLSALVAPGGEAAAAASQ
jgi:hypothetical protein